MNQDKSKPDYVGGSSVSSSNDNGRTLNSNVQMLTKRYLTTKDAYVTGYFFVTIDNIPPAFVSHMQENYYGEWNEDKIIRVFTSMAIDIGLPEETLKTLPMPSRGGYTRTSPLFSQRGNAVTINFLVDQSLETSTLFSAWYEYIAMVADGRLEVTSRAIDGSQSITNIFGSNFYYCTLLPNMRDIVFAFVGEGFYPTTKPDHDFSHSVNNYDALRHSITFNIDYYDTWTFNKKPMLWLKNYLTSQIEKYSATLFDKTASKKNDTVKDKTDPNKSPGEGKRSDIDSTMAKLAQPKRTNDGSIYDKYNSVVRRV